MGLHSRLVVRGGWGRVIPPAFGSYVNRAGLVDTATAAATYGVMRYGKAPGPGEADTRPVGLIPTPLISNTLTRSDVSVLTGNADHCIAHQHAFENTDSLTRGYGLGWLNTEPDSPVLLRVFPRAGTIPTEGEGVAIRVYLYPTPSEQEGRIWSLKWGTPGNGYHFQLRNGRAEMGRLAAEWTEALHNSVQALWQKESVDNIPLSPEEYTTLAETTQAIYQDWQGLSFEKGLGADADSWYGKTFTLMFIQEPIGNVHVALNGDDFATFEGKDLRESGWTPGPLWSVYPVDIASNGGAFFFQMGSVRFAAQGELRYGPFRHSYWSEFLDQAQLKVNAWEWPPFARPSPHGTIPAADIDYRIEPVNVQKSNLVATLRGPYAGALRTPFLYGLGALIPPGWRDGSQDVWFDSDDYPTAILDMKPSWDGDMRARQVEITLADVDGNITFGLKDGGRQGIDAFVNRVAALAVGGTAFGAGGLIVRGTATDMRNMSQSEYGEGPATVYTLTWRDGWHVLGEQILSVPVIVDGERLGAALRLLLKCAGIYESSLAGISPTAGPRIPAAKLGRDWAWVAQGKIDAAVRTLMESFGLGYYLWQNADGVWQLTQQSESIVAAFSSAPDAGRYYISSDLSAIRDYDGFYNSFRVVGGDRGQWVFTYTNMESIMDPTYPGWVGRLIEYDTQKVTGCSTKDEVAYILESLKFRYGKPGLRWQFGTFFHVGLKPGDRITCDGRLCEIECINDASIAEDQMVLQVREVIDP